MHRKIVIALAVTIVTVGVFGSAALTFSAFNPEINYQGKLTDSNDAAVADGTYHMKFRLYDAETGGTELWEGNRSEVPGNRVDVVSGLFSVMLGSSTPLTSVDFNQTLWLEVEIGGTASSSWETLSPRKRLGAVPAAFEAGNLDGLDSTQFLRSDEPDTIASSSATTLLTVNQSGGGNILEVQDGGTPTFTVFDGGTVGLGTSTAAHTLTVDGDAKITDALYASSTLTVDGLATFANLTATEATSTTQAITNLFIGGDLLTELVGTGLTNNSGSLETTLGTSISESELTINAPTDDYLLVASSTATGGWEWVATSTERLGLSGVTTYTGLTDTQSSLTANRIIFASSTGSTLTDNANFVFDGDNTYLGVGTSSPASTLDVWGDVRFGTSSIPLFFSDVSENHVGIATSTSPYEFTVAGDAWITGDLLAKTGGTATFVIAANDASARMKNQADYVADGTADDVQIQAALDALPASGGKIFLSEGTFSISTAISLPSNVELFGSGQGVTTIQVAGSTNIKALVNADQTNGNSDITLRNFTLDGNKANQDGDNGEIAIHYVKVGNSTIDSVEVKNADGEGIRVSGGGVPTYNVTLHNLAVRNNGTIGLRVLFGMRSISYSQIVAEDNGTIGVLIDHSEGTVNNIWADNNGTYGININNVFGATYNNLVATRNGQHGIFVTGMVASQGSNWRAQSNGTDVSNTYDDIYFDDDNAQSYGVTDDVLITSVFVGGDSLFGSSPERYGIYFEDGVNGNVRLLNVAYGDTVNSGFIRKPTALNNIIVLDSTDDSPGLSLTGRLGIGTSSPAFPLDVWGDVRFGTSSTPLFFVDASTNAVGIGTSTPPHTLTVDGDARIAGALYDSVNSSAGSNGFVLQTTGSGTEWVATSTLGITGEASDWELDVDGNLTPTSTVPVKITDALYASSTLTVDGLATFANLTATEATSTTQAITNLFIGGDLLTELVGTGLTNNSGSLETTLGTSISESELTINAPTDDYLLVASSTATGGWEWVATSSSRLGLGGGGASTYLELTDTQSSFTQNRIIHTNAAGDALTDTSGFVFDGTNLGVGSSTPSRSLTIGGDAFIGGAFTATGTPTFETLTASRLVATDANKALVSTITEANLESSISDVTALFTDNVTGDVTLSGGTSAIGAGVVVEPDLNINAPTDDYLLVASSTATGGWEWVATSSSRLGLGGGSGTPGGSDSEIQYNDGSSFGGISTFLFEDTLGRFTLGTSTLPANSSTLTIQATSTDTANILELEDSSGVSLFTFSTTSELTIGDGSGSVTDSVVQFGADGDAWTLGFQDSTKSFLISSSTQLGTNDVFAIQKGTNNVGIGTSTPGEKLTVTGDARITDRLAVGASSSVDSKFTILAEEFSTENDGAIGIKSRLTWDPASDVSFDDATGIFSDLQIPSSNSANISNLYGTYSNVLYDGSGTSTNQYALYAFSNQNGSNNLINSYGVNALGYGGSSNFGVSAAGYNYTTRPGSTYGGQFFGWSDGGISSGTNNVYGASAQIDVTGATGGTHNTYGYYLDVANLDDAGAGTHTAYGLFLENVTGADTNYAIYSEGADSYLGDRLGIGSTTASALLSIEHTAGNNAFQIGSSTATSFIVNESGNVGIGTAAPSAELDISANSGSILFSGLSGASMLRFSEDSGVQSTGMQLVFRTSPNQLIVEDTADGTNGTDIFYLDRDDNSAFFAGNVGIGTTTPSRTLTVGGDAFIGGALTATGTPTFETLTGSRLVATDANKALVSTITEANLEASISDVTALFTNNTTGDVTITGDTSAIGSGVIVEPDLNINAPTDNYLLVASSTATGGWEWVATSSSRLGLGGGSGTPGGSDTEVQYNNSGSFGGAAGLTYDDTSGLVTVTHQTDAASVEGFKIVGPDRATVADGDEVQLNFYQEDAGGTAVNGARITSSLVNTGAGGEDFELRLGVVTDSGALDDDLVKIGNGWMLRSGTNNNPALLGNGNSGPTTANYTFQGDNDTGIGRATADSLSLIAGGIELARLVESTEDYVEFNGDFLRVATSTGDPTDSTEGNLYGNTSDNNLYYYDGTSWVDLTGGGASTFTGLTDTQGSLTANRIIFASSTGSSLTDSANFVFDGDNTRLGIGSTTPAHTLTVAGAGRVFDFQNTTDAASSQVGVFRGPDRATPAIGDQVYISGYMEDSSDTYVEYGRIGFEATGVISGGSHDGAIVFSPTLNGTPSEMARFESDNGVDDGLVFAASDGPAILNEGSNLTNPTLIPNKASLNTGIGMYDLDGNALLLIHEGTAVGHGKDDRFESTFGNDGYWLHNTGAAATTPTLGPNKTDYDTGIGWAAADQLSLVAGGIELARLVESTEDYIEFNGDFVRLATSTGDPTDETEGNLYGNTTDNNLYYYDGTSWVDLTAGGGASTFTGLTDTQGSLTANRIIFASSTGSELTDSANFVFDGTNLGIGTSSPSSALDVTGTVTLQPTSGSGDITTILNEGVTTTIDVGGTANNILVLDNDNQTWRLQAKFNGDLGGVGGMGFQTSDANATTTLAATPNGSGDASEFTFYSGGPYLTVGADNSSYETYIKSQRVGTNASAPLTFYTKPADGIDTERMRITSDGLVGIGTTSPSYLLDVDGDFRVGEAGQSNAFFVDATNGEVGIGTNNPGATLDLFQSASSILFSNGTGPHLIRFTDDASEANGVQLGYRSSPNQFVIESIADGTDGTDIFYLDRDDSSAYFAGNVGIGTTSPSALLAIEHSGGSNAFQVGSSTDTNFLIDEAGRVGIKTLTPTHNLEVHGTSITTAAALFKNTGSSGPSAGAGFFLEHDDGAALASGDRLGGFVYGGSIDSTDTNNSIAILGYADGAWTSSSAPARLVFNITPSGSLASSEVLRIEEDGNICGTDSAFEACSSDERLKKDIVTVSEFDLNTIKDLEAVRFSWNDLAVEEYGYSPDDQFIGFIAQDVEDVVPGWVSTDEKGYFKVDNGELRFALLKGLQQTISVLDITDAPTTSPSLTVTSNGQVGVGTSTPQYALHIAGDAAATGFINTSSENTKKDIHHITKSKREKILDDIQNINVAQYRYAFEDESNPLRLGLIAEEAPSDVLSVDGKGVDLYKLSTFTLAGLQELSSEVEDIDSRVAELESALAQLSSSTASTSTALSTGTSSSTTNSSSGSNLFDDFLAYLSDLGVKISQGLLEVNDLFASTIVVENSLTVGSPENPRGITLHDEATGEPFCFSIRNGNMRTHKGTCDERAEKLSGGIDGGSSYDRSDDTSTTLSTGGTTEEDTATTTDSTTSTTTATTTDPVTDDGSSGETTVSDGTSTTTDSTTDDISTELSTSTSTHSTGSGQAGETSTNTEKESTDTTTEITSTADDTSTTEETSTADTGTTDTSTTDDTSTTEDVATTEESADTTTSS